MKIYTKTGDTGKTSLCSGKRVEKTSFNIEALGTIDELNSILGLAVSFSKNNEINSILEKIQTDLFVLGGEIAGSDKKINQDHIKNLENLIDKYQKKIPELKNFILPGGSRSGSYIHLARTVCRRAERSVIELKDKYPDTLAYLNRLSDLLFVLARVINKTQEQTETIVKYSSN